MSLGRYMLLKCAVGFGLFMFAVIPFAFFAGWLASLVPEAASSVAFGLVGLIWILGLGVGTHILTEKLSKRWSK